MTKILNRDAFKTAVDAYAIQMGFSKADGTAKRVSQISQKAIELAILTYILNDDRLKEILDDSK